MSTNRENKKKENKLKISKKNQFSEQTSEYFYKINSLQFDKNHFKIPKELSSLISKYIKNKDIKSVFDPFVATTDDLTPFLLKKKFIKKLVGVVLDPRLYKIIKSQALLNNLNASYLLGDSLEQLTKVKEKFDAIISFPPMIFSLKNKQLEKWDFSKISDDYPNIVIWQSLDKLKDGGECIFIAPDSFLLKQNGVRKNLKERGYYINSIIKLPSSILRPYSSRIPNIIVISKKKTDEIFIAEFSSDYDNNKFVNSWINKIVGSIPELGVMVNSDELITVDHYLNKIKAENELEKYPYSRVTIKELINEVNLGASAKNNNGFEDKPNSIFIPTIGVTPVVNTVSNLKIKPQNYIQLVLNKNKVINEYLSGFLNSKVGLKLLDTIKTGEFIKKITKQNIKEIAIPLPDLRKQHALIYLDNQIKQLSSIANNLSFELWNRPTALSSVKKDLNLINKGDEIEYLIKRLPFPVASILMKYHREDNPHKKLEYLNYFFEALTELLCTILISAFYHDKNGLSILKEILDTDRDKAAIKKTTFGGWVNISSRFSKKFREFISSEKDEDKEYAKELLKIDNLSTLNALLSKDIYVVLDEVSKKRNDWLGHSAPVSNKEAQKRHELLKYNLDKIYDPILDLFSEYKLLKPRNEMVFEDDIFRVKVDVAIGSDTNFERTTINLIKPLEKNRLHFYEEGNNQSLTLLPFVKLRPSPETELNSCYFYNRTEKKGDYRWLSYHFDYESEIVEGDKVLEEVIEKIT